MNLKKFLQEIEIEHIKKALEENPNNYAAASDSLEMNRTTFLAKLKQYGLYERRMRSRRDYSKNSEDV
jgi:DNA-binding NtrC family response regulator